METPTQRHRVYPRPVTPQRESREATPRTDIRNSKKKKAKTTESAKLLREVPRTRSPSSPFDTKVVYDRNDPRTWPKIHIPYAVTENTSSLQCLDDMMVFVRFKGGAADTLRHHFADAIADIVDPEQERAIGRLAFKLWPFNVTLDGHWKEHSKIQMTKSELAKWQAMDIQKCAGDVWPDG